MEKPVPPSAYFTLLKICSLRMTMTSSGFFFFMGIIGGKESQQQRSWDCSVVMEMGGGNSQCFSVSEMNTKDAKLRFGYISFSTFMLKSTY